MVARSLLVVLIVASYVALTPQISESQGPKVRIAVAADPYGLGISKLRAFAGAVGIELVQVQTLFEEYLTGKYRGIIHFASRTDSTYAPIRDALEKRGGRAVIVVERAETDLQSTFGVGFAYEQIVRGPSYQLAGEHILEMWRGLKIGAHSRGVPFSGFLVPNVNDASISDVKLLPSQEVRARNRVVSCRVTVSGRATVLILAMPTTTHFLGSDRFIDQYDNQEAALRLLSWVAGRD